MTQSVSFIFRDMLPTSEDAWLRGLSDGLDEWKKVQEQEEALKMAKRSLSLQLAQKRKALKDLESEIDVIAGKIQARSEEICTRLPNVEVLYSPLKDSEMTLS